MVSGLGRQGFPGEEHRFLPSDSWDDRERGTRHGGQTGYYTDYTMILSIFNV